MARTSTTNFVKKINAKIGNNIRNLRIARGLTGTELSERINFTRQQLHKYESGLNSISAVNLYQISNALGADLYYFYGKSETILGDSENQTLCLHIAKKLLKVKNTDLLQSINKLLKAY